MCGFLNFCFDSRINKQASNYIIIIIIDILFKHAFIKFLVKEVELLLWQ